MLYHWSMDSNCSTPISYLNFLTAYFAKRNLNSGDFEKRAIRNPARIPPQTPPAGGKSAEAGRIHSPRHIVSPCRVRFNRLDFARSNFELRPVDTAKKIVRRFQKVNSIRSCRKNQAAARRAGSSNQSFRGILARFGYHRFLPKWRPIPLPL